VEWIKPPYGDSGVDWDSFPGLPLRVPSGFILGYFPSSRQERIVDERTPRSKGQLRVLCPADASAFTIHWKVTYV